MPAIISDPSFRARVTNQSRSIFDYPDTPAPSILNFQAAPSQPLPEATATATGLLAPDLVLTHRLRNFSPDIFDLSPSSALIHFMQALLGDSGTGQLRKRQFIARLQSALHSTQFYDLDTFWGSIFGALRGPDGALPLNPATSAPVSPYTDLASPDGWDQVHAIDALFRERIIALAKAVTLGGTIPGLRAVAEALLGVPCHVVEIYKLIDTQGSQTLPSVRWSQMVSSYPHWSLTAGQSWQQIEGILILGGMGINARNEVMIQPRTQYGSSVASQAQAAADQWGVLRVAEKIKPSFSLLSISYQSALANVPVSIHSLWADSDYWEIVPYVSPKDPTDPAYAPAFSSYQAGGTTVGNTFPQPVPALSQAQGTQYSYASDVTACWAQSGLLASPADLRDYDIVAYPTGVTLQYLPGKAVIQPDRAASVRASSSVAVKAAPYSGPRVMVPGVD